MELGQQGVEQKELSVASRILSCQIRRAPEDHPGEVFAGRDSSAEGVVVPHIRQLTNVPVFQVHEKQLQAPGGLRVWQGLTGKEKYASLPRIVDRCRNRAAQLVLGCE